VRYVEKVVNGTGETILCTFFSESKTESYKPKAKWWTAERESERVIVPVIRKTPKLSVGKDSYFVHGFKGGKSE
jgi:hypothetical protein